MNIIHGLPPITGKNEFVSVDTEFFRMNSKQLHRPTSGKFACATFCPNDEDVYIITDPEMIKPALENIDAGVWVTQNGKFDITQLRRFTYVPIRKKWWDTFYCEKIMYGGYYDMFGLEDIARRTLGIYVDKSMQKYFENHDELIEDAIYYSCMDALITRKIGIEQYNTIDKRSFNVWKNIDQPFTWAVMDFAGFPIDPDKIIELANENLSMAEQISKDLPFNYRSPKQIMDWAKQNKIKISATNEDELLDYIHRNPDGKHNEILKAVLDARGYYHMASTYGKGLLDNYLEQEQYPDYHDGTYPVVYPNINPNQAETGRTSANDPNIQNQPNDKRFRSCYHAAPGYKIVIADYSAQEPRITAYLSQDEKLMGIFRDGKDVYIEMFRYMFGKEITKKDPERKKMKPVFLGMTYGLTEYGLSAKEGIPLKEAKELLDKSMATFPGVREWQRNQKAKKQYVETVNGRRIWINPYSDQGDRNKLNAPVQGTAADMMKKGIAEMHQTWCFDPYKFAVCAPIHDEVVLHVPEAIAQDVAAFTKNTLEMVAEQMCPGIPFIADVCVGESWADK